MDISLKKRKRKHNDDDDDNPLLKLFANDNIENERNHIYFYSEVTQESCLSLNKKLTNMIKQVQKHKIDYELSEMPKIYLHINSYGGSVFACFSTLDIIKYSPVPIVTIIEGCAASAATIMSVVAHERYMTPHSYMLIHQLSSGMWGKYEEQKDDFDNNTRLMESILNIYIEHTKLSEKKLKRFLRHDLWWDSDTCLKNGLVDGFWANGKILSEEEDK